MRIIVIIGHSKNSQGAVNKLSGVSEFDFFRKVAHDIERNFPEHNMSDEIVVMYRENGYQKLPSEINELEPDLIVSLHANAFDTTVEGCETLYYHKSAKGKEIAQIIQDKLVSVIVNKDRGIKPKTSEDRGGYLLKETAAPCVICEPFFIDNILDYRIAEELFDKGNLTTAFCEAINEAAQYLRGA